MPPRAPGPAFIEKTSPDLDPEVVRMVKEKLVNAKHDPSTLIDSGGAATVHTIINTFCAKIFRPRTHDQKPGNSVSVESAFLDRVECVQDISVMRTPRCFGFIQGPSAEDPGAIIMEELPAVNLQRIFNGEYDDLLPSMDLKHLKEALEDFVGELHMAGILHGDLEARNILVDTTNPKMYYLVDFGRAKNTSLEARIAKGQLETELTDIERMFEGKIAI